MPHPQLIYLPMCKQGNNFIDTGLFLSLCFYITIIQRFNYLIEIPIVSN